MKLILLKNNLIQCLSVIERGISESSHLPILKSVYVKAHNGKISFVATNLEIAIEYNIQGKATEDGEVVFPFSTFYSVVRNINSEKVALETREKKLFIVTDNYEGSLPLQNEKEFPIIPQLSHASVHIKTNTEYFKDVFSRVFVATQFSEIRPEISGVYLHNKGGEYTVVSTDSFRLSEIVLDSQKFSGTGDVSAIFPFKSISEIIRIFSLQNESLEILIDETQVLFKTETKQVISRLVDGNFPDYKGIIAQASEKDVCVLLSRDELIQSVKLISSFSGKANDVVIRALQDAKVVEVYSSDSTIGENTYKISVKTKPLPFSVVLNWKYLLDGLKIFKGEEIEFRITERPIIIRSASDGGMVYVVMPIGKS